jgi:hypothetical protein
MRFLISSTSKFKLGCHAHMPFVVVVVDVIGVIVVVVVVDDDVIGVVVVVVVVVVDVDEVIIVVVVVVVVDDDDDDDVDVVVVELSVGNKYDVDDGKDEHEQGVKEKCDFLEHQPLDGSDGVDHDLVLDRHLGPILLEQFRPEFPDKPCNGVKCVFVNIC